MAAAWEEPPVLYQQLDASSLVFGPSPPSPASPSAFPPSGGVDTEVKCVAAAASDSTAGQFGVADGGTRAFQGGGRGGDTASNPVGEDDGNGEVEDTSAADVAFKPSRYVLICSLYHRPMYTRLENPNTEIPVNRFISHVMHPRPSSLRCRVKTLDATQQILLPFASNCKGPSPSLLL